MGVWDKVSNVFFKEEEYEDGVTGEVYQDVKKDNAAPEVKEPVSRDVWQEPEVKKTRRGQTVNVPTSGGSKTMEMTLIKAKSYDDMQSIAQNIKERKVVIVNFEDLEKETAQRMVDFLSGAVFALDGVPKKVSRGTFLFSTSQVDLEGQIMENDANTPSFEGTFDPESIWRR